MIILKLLIGKIGKLLSTTVSAKIPKHLREKLRERHVDISKVVRSALEKEVERQEDEELKAKLQNLTKLSNKITIKDIVKAVRLSREER